MDCKSVSGLTVYPTEPILFYAGLPPAPTAAELQARLLRDHKMYVRDCSNKVGMDNLHIRIASQGREKDASVVQALRELVG